MEKRTPIWKGKFIKNEPLVFIKEKDIIYCKLIYSPSKVVNVETVSGEILVEGKDYKIDNRKIILFSKAVKFFEKEWLLNINVPKNIPNENEKYKIEGTLLVSPKDMYEYFSFITYYTEDTEFISNPVKNVSLPKTLLKIRSEKKLDIRLLGDSIGEAANSTFEMGIGNGGCWYNSFSESVKSLFGNDVDFTNVSRSGYGTEWGLSVVDEKFSDGKADLVAIEFGGNDGSERMPFETYITNIKLLMEKIKKHCDCEFILIPPFVQNKNCPQTNGCQRDYIKPLSELQGKGICFINTFKTFDEIYERIDYSSMSGNNLNHPNDFCYSVYSDAIYTVFEKLKQKQNIFINQKLK